MKNLTVTLDEDLFRSLRMRAAEENKSMSRIVADTLQAKLGQDRSTSQTEALMRFLAGPDMALLTESGRAPMRDELYD